MPADCGAFGCSVQLIMVELPDQFLECLRSGIFFCMASIQRAVRVLVLCVVLRWLQLEGAPRTLHGTPAQSSLGDMAVGQN